MNFIIFSKIYEIRLILNSCRIHFKFILISSYFFRLNFVIFSEKIIKIILFRVIPIMTCWVEVVRWGLSSSDSRSFQVTASIRQILFCYPLNACHLLPATHQENFCQIYVKTAATAHAQTCQNMSGYDLSNIYEETEIKHVSRPPEARSKVIATATTHAQITNALQCVTRNILCTKHDKLCQDTTCQHINRISRRHQICQ